MEQENPMPSDIKMVTPSGYPFGTQASNLYNYPLTTFCPAIKIRKKKEDDAAAWKFPRSTRTKKNWRGLESRPSGRIALFCQEFPQMPRHRRCRIGYKKAFRTQKK